MAIIVRWSEPWII